MAKTDEKQTPEQAEEKFECPACRNWRDDCRLCGGAGEVTKQQAQDHGAEP